MSALATPKKEIKNSCESKDEGKNKVSDELVVLGKYLLLGPCPKFPNIEEIKS